MSVETVEREQTRQEQEEAVITFLNALKSYKTEETPLPEREALFAR